MNLTVRWRLTGGKLEFCRARSTREQGNSARARERIAGLVLRELRPAPALVVGLPGPAAPLPVGKDEFEGAADHSDRSRAPVDERERLCCRLRSDHGGEHGIARGGICGGVTG